MANLIVSSIGLGLFVYGKRQDSLIPLTCGILLMIIPYFIANGWLLAMATTVVAAVTYLSRG